MKRSVTLGAAALLLLSLAGCSAGADTHSTPSASGAPGPSALAKATGVTEITFWHGLGGI